MSQLQRFNEPQARRLLSTASHIDKLLLEIEEILSASSSNVFPRYKNALAPVQVRAVRDYIKRLRQQMIHVLEDLEVTLPEPAFDSTFSIKVMLQFIQIALEEIAPQRLVGYGTVPQSLLKPLAGGIQEMTGIARQMDFYLSQPIEADLSNRLHQLRHTDADAGLLKTLGEIVERHSLSEFRQPLAGLVEKIEFPTYEIAFFGRVSTGKSSLLNAMIGTNLLPVGVTPITALPTRVKNSANSQLLVWSAEGRFAKYSVEDLPEFVTEAQNPGNEKRVAKLLVEVPLSILPEEVLLVDTPGLGSLALDGAAETLAYLPHCDLGVVLVDSASNLQTDDVATVDALRAASVPALVVLSKADLIPEQDRERLLDYTRAQLVREFHIDIDVALLSSRPESASLLREWVNHQLSPRLANARQLSRESNQRKTRSLAREILSALEVSAQTSGRRFEKLPDGLKAAETQLRNAASLIEDTWTQCADLTDRIRNSGGRALNRLAESAIVLWQEEPGSFAMDNVWIARKIEQFAWIEAGHLSSLIQKTAQDLTAALGTAASVLTAREQEDRFSLHDFVKEMPPAYFSCPSLRLTRPRLLRMSVGFAQHSTRNELEKRLGGSIIAFFTSYGRTLEIWFRRTVDILTREFDVYADVYRAQLQRLTVRAGSHELVSAESSFEAISTLKRELDLNEAEPVESGVPIS